MKVAPRQLETFLRQPPSEINAVLLHGNDFGLISERAKQLAKHYAQDLDDVFAVTRLDGDSIAGEPGLIADSAAAIAMFGATRLVLVKGRGTDLLDACKLALASDLTGSFIIVEASDTTTKHAIVKLFDTAKNAASIGCYADSDGDIAALVREIVQKDNINIDPETIKLIVSKLGSDRIASRGEIEKLALYAGAGGSLTMDDVALALGDSASLAVTDIAISAANGATPQLKRDLAKAWTEDLSAIMVLRGCQGYFRQLEMAGYACATGKSASEAVRGIRPPVHFKLQDIMARQLRNWRAHNSADAVNKLQDAELTIKSGGVDERVICAQSLLGLCLRAIALSRSA